MTGRVCAHCGLSIDHLHGKARYCGERCRDRAYRQRLARTAEAAGFPGRLTIKTLESTADPRGPSADAQRPPAKRSRSPYAGIRPSIPTIGAAEVALAVLDGDLTVEQAGDELEPTREAIRRALERRRKRAA